VAGFSLIELLVAMGIMGLVMTLGIRSFSMLTTAWNDTQSLAQLSDYADTAFDMIEIDLKDVLSAELSGVSIIGIDQTVSNTREFNRADDASDRLIIPIQGSFTGGSLQQTRSIQYQVVRDNGRSMLRRTMGNLGDPNPSSVAFDIIPLADTLRFDIAFATGDADMPWAGEWSSDALPVAVRVSMTLAVPVEGYAYRQVSRKEVFMVHVR